MTDYFYVSPLKSQLQISQFLDQVYLEFFSPVQNFHLTNHLRKARAIRPCAALHDTPYTFNYQRCLSLADATRTKSLPFQLHEPSNHSPVYVWLPRPVQKQIAVVDFNPPLPCQENSQVAVQPNRDTICIGCTTIRSLIFMLLNFIPEYFRDVSTGNSEKQL